MLKSSKSFEYQVETLVKHGLARYTDADPFRARMPKKGSFLFLPRHPKKTDYQALMQLIVHNGVRGKTTYKSKLISDDFDTPRTASLLLDVDDGQKKRVYSPWAPSIDAKARIAKEGRHPYTAFQGIIHAILYPEFIPGPQHYVELLGSLYDRGGKPFALSTILYLEHHYREPEKEVAPTLSSSYFGPAWWHVFPSYGNLLLP